VDYATENRGIEDSDLSLMNDGYLRTKLKCINFLIGRLVNGFKAVTL
jgi:hypothetical protein